MLVLSDHKTSPRHVFIDVFTAYVPLSPLSQNLCLYSSIFPQDTSIVAIYTFECSVFCIATFNAAISSGDTFVFNACARRSFVNPLSKH